MWEIGVLAGETPCSLASPVDWMNPVLTARDVTDVDAEFVADPFMIRRGGEWHLFFEVLRRPERRGEIGWALSRNGRSWEYQRIVLREEFHLSYPCVFEWGGSYYMIPETLAASEVRLYKSAPFPDRWQFRRALIRGQFADPTIFRHQNHWWMFVCGTPYGHDSLRLFGAADLEGPWVEHPASPIIASDARFARPAGRVVASEGKLLRFAQDCSSLYGHQVWAFEIVRLDELHYEEKMVSSSPVIGEGTDAQWLTSRMHHLDSHAQSGGGWLACVDGWAAAESR